MADPSVLFLDQSGALGGAELCLLDYLRRRRGPSEAVVFADGPFVSALREAGVSTRLLPFDPEVNKASGVLRQFAAAPHLVAFSRQIAQVAKDHDIIYANTQKAAIAGALAAWMSRRPLVWHLHDILDSDHFSRANRVAVIAVTNRVRCSVIANSQATAAAYRRAGGRHAVTVVYNGIDPGPFERAGDTSASAVRGALGVPPQKKVVGLFGRLTPWKGQHVLLEALESESLSDVVAVFVGDALYTDEDRDYAAALRQTSARESLAGRVYWLGHRNDVPAVMAACDVIAHCSTQPEPFGRVIVEGMLAGRPVIATDAGGAKEIVEHGATGLLTPPGDAGALASAIQSLISDPLAAKRIADAGRDSALLRFRLGDRVREMDAVLSEAMRVPARRIAAEE